MDAPENQTVYKKMYEILFHAITEALRELSEQNIGIAKTFLMQAQWNSEEVYLRSGEEDADSDEETPDA